MPPLELDVYLARGTPRPHYVAARARCKWRWRRSIYHHDHDQSSVRPHHPKLHQMPVALYPATGPENCEVGSRKGLHEDQFSIPDSNSQCEYDFRQSQRSVIVVHPRLRPDVALGRRHPLVVGSKVRPSSCVSPRKIGVLSVRSWPTRPASPVPSSWNVPVTVECVARMPALRGRLPEPPGRRRNGDCRSAHLCATQ